MSISASILLISLATSALFCLAERDNAFWRTSVAEMFEHSWSSYLRFGWPNDELRPISCVGIESGILKGAKSMLTLIDALDTLAIMGRKDDFVSAISLIRSDAFSFDADANVSVFEINIRILGPIIASHLLLSDPDLEFRQWMPEYDGSLLLKARDLADRLLPAFDTPTGMPFGTVNLRYGVPEGETPIVATSGAGTFILEFGALSRILGDQKYERAAWRALLAVYSRKSKLGLFGSHIDSQSGKWTHLDSGIGSYIDSFYEYLLKGSILFNDELLRIMFYNSYEYASQYIKSGKIWRQVHAESGRGFSRDLVVESLSAFWPGLLTLTGDFKTARAYLDVLLDVRKKFGFLPERFNISQDYKTGISPLPRFNSYHLRPELAESLWYMYRATRESKYLQHAKMMVHSIQETCRVKCGFAHVDDVTTGKLSDKMESFFLAETLKYLYLIFDEENVVNQKDFVLTTEGHLIPITYLSSIQKYDAPDLQDIFQEYKILIMSFANEDALLDGNVHAFDISFNLPNSQPIGRGEIPLATKQKGSSFKLKDVSTSDLLDLIDDQLEAELRRWEQDIHRRSTQNFEDQPHKRLIKVLSRSEYRTCSLFKPKWSLDIPI